MYALNASTGALLWSYTTGRQCESSPAVANGVVYVGSDDGNVYALNASTGAKLWSYPPATMCFPRPPWRMGWCMSARTTERLCAERQHRRQAVELPHRRLM